MTKTVKFVLLMATMSGLCACSIGLKKPANPTLVRIQAVTPVETQPKLTTENSVTQINRYQTVKNAPTTAQINPLLSISQFKFNANIKTTGDAITHILLNSGYHLSPKSMLSSDVVTVLDQPLPVTQRELGPITLMDALKTIMGKDVYEIQVDPIHRLVTFKIKPEYKKFVQTTKP